MQKSRLDTFQAVVIFHLVVSKAPAKYDVNRLVGRVFGGKNLRQIRVMQDSLFLEVAKEKGKAMAKAACARAWRDLEDIKRVIRGLPGPGVLRPESPTGGRGKRRPALEWNGPVVDVTPQPVVEPRADNSTTTSGNGATS